MKRSYALDDERELSGNLPGVDDSGSHKVQHNLDVISVAIELFWVTIMDLMKNSSDSCSVAATRSKSDEFLIRSIVFTEL